MNFKNDILYPILLAAGYFISIFAFIAALGPVYLGLIVALVVTLQTVLELAWLRHIGMAESGPVIFVVGVLPIVMGLCAISA